VRQTANELTGEHSCLMIKPMPTSEIELPGGLGADWLEAYRSDFQKRMLTLLGYEFRNLSCRLAFNLVQGRKEDVPEVSTAISSSLLTPYISQFDLKRLESYSKNMVDFHLIMDLVPTIARLYFYQLPAGVFNLSPV